MKKKLLITGSTFPRCEGDTEPRFILDLSKELNEYYDVTVLVPAFPGCKFKEVLEGVKVIRYRYFLLNRLETLCYPGAIVPRIKERKSRALLVPFLMLGMWIKLIHILPEYDIVHANWIVPQGIIQSFFKKKYILTGHGGDVSSLNKGIVKKLKERALKHAESVTVVSNALKEQLQSLYGIKEVEVVSMGCDTKKFGRKFRIENYFGQGDKKVILFVGRLAEKKGVKYLIEAVEGIDAILIIVGDGPLRIELENQASRSSNRIDFLGPKNHEELKRIYASADIFVAPSITAEDGDKEGVPTAIMEALASGLPVVSTRSGGIAELVRDGIEGYLNDEKDVTALKVSISALLSDEEQYQSMAQAALQRSKDYDYTKIAAQYAKIIGN